MGDAPSAECARIEAQKAPSVVRCGEGWGGVSLAKGGRGFGEGSEPPQKKNAFECK